MVSSQNSRLECCFKFVVDVSFVGSGGFGSTQKDHPGNREIARSTIPPQVKGDRRHRTRWQFLQEVKQTTREGEATKLQE
jgi:hypothetical protein